LERKVPVLLLKWLRVWDQEQEEGELIMITHTLATGAGIRGQKGH